MCGIVFMSFEIHYTDSARIGVPDKCVVVFFLNGNNMIEAKTVTETRKKRASQQTRGSFSSSFIVQTMKKCCWHFAEDAFNVSYAQSYVSHLSLVQNQNQCQWCAIFSSCSLFSLMFKPEIIESNRAAQINQTMWLRYYGHVMNTRLQWNNFMTLIAKMHN